MCRFCNQANCNCSKPSLNRSIDVPDGKKIYQDKTKIACIHCRKSKVKCEDGYPCKRCLRLKLNDCKPCPIKKRGPKKRKTSDDMDRPESPNLVGHPYKVLSKILCTEINSYFHLWKGNLKPNDSHDSFRFWWFCNCIKQMITSYLATDIQFVDEDIKKKYLKLLSEVEGFCSNASHENTLRQISNRYHQKVVRIPPIINVGMLMIDLIPFPFHENSNKSWANNSIAEMLGFTPLELSIKLRSKFSFYSLFHESSIIYIFNNFWDSIRTGQSVYQGPVKMLHKSGRLLDFTQHVLIDYLEDLPVKWYIQLRTPNAPPVSLLNENNDSHSPITAATVPLVINSDFDDWISEMQSTISL